MISSISRTSGGPARSVQGLVARLNRVGVKAWLLTLRHGDEPWVEGVKLFANGEPFENVVARIKPDIVHLHGLWSFGLHRCVLICRRWRIPYIIAPRGMLEPWSLEQKWLKKRIARWLYQDRDLKYAVALHATAESEAKQFRQLGFGNKVIVSPNGVNVPKTFEPRKTLNTRKKVLFVSRMHPKKGALELVEAWGHLVVRGQWSVVSGWTCELVYTVSGEIEQEYEARVKARVKDLGLQDQFVFTGALNDDEKWKAYARADLFVLPTYSENFGIVVAEALWAGVPVITTNGTPWIELETKKCGWWINIGVEPLAKTLDKAMALDDAARREMGEQGRNLVEEKYIWDAVVKEMVKGYEKVIVKKR